MKHIAIYIYIYTYSNTCTRCQPTSLTPTTTNYMMYLIHRNFNKLECQRNLRNVALLTF